MNTEYGPERFDVTLKQYPEVMGLDESGFARDRGHHKSPEQRLYKKPVLYREKLAEYVEKRGY